MIIKQPIYFSQRNGYSIPSEMLTLEEVPQEVGNAIMSAFLRLVTRINGPLGISFGTSSSDELCEYLWTHFFHKGLSAIRGDRFTSSAEIILRAFSSSKMPWYKKLDFIEAVISFSETLVIAKTYVKDFISEINGQFESLGYGYRIIKGSVIEITADIEKKAIETAINDGRKPVKDALMQALSAHCVRPVGDYAGSMKNSLSAVEIECHRLTGESKLGKGLNKLKSKGIKVHPQLEAAFHSLYNYSNDEKTGIRHGKKVAEDSYVPTAKESLFMLVACSAFINYLRSCELEHSSDTNE